MNNENTNQNNFDVRIFNLNNYVMPSFTPYMGNLYTLNGGADNSFFRYIKERYYGSPTNAAIINNYVKYIYGNGLKEKSGEFNPNLYLSKKDLKLMVQDYEMFGQFTVQVVWSQGSKLLKQEPKPTKFKFIPTEKIGLKLLKEGHIGAYWYCFDWRYQARFRPVLFQKFTGEYTGQDIELITFTRTSSEPYFPQPDYVSGLQWAHVEEELSNGGISHIKNGFSGGTIVNCRGGVPATDELRAIYTKKIIDGLTGTNNKNRVIVNFSNGLDAGDEIEVKNIEIKGLDAQLVYFSEEAQRKIFMAHSVVNPILFGAQNTAGLGNNADEMQQALKTLYRTNINPKREDILDSLEYLFSFVAPDLELEFEDFEELTMETPTNLSNEIPTTQIDHKSIAKLKAAFDPKNNKR